MPNLPDDSFFEALAAAGIPPEVAPPPKLRERLLAAINQAADAEKLYYPELAAPARLKSRIYSALVQAQAAEAPLRALSECEDEGRRLCVFEILVRIAPVGQMAQSINYCRVCHARVLAERMEAAPIYWPGCPYAEFQNR